ncbi:MAG: phosphotransferase [Alphaproteobacteria bacterium]|nr:phosphotransferase [Alphaproteobacteria bacterium]
MIAALCAQWGLRAAPEVLGDGVNRVWGVGDRVLRWSARWPRAQVEAELDFVRHLDEQGVSVARPAATPGGAWTVPHAGGVAVAFERAPGVSPTALTPTFLRAWGAHLAAMHRAAEGWTGARPHWLEDPWWVRAHALIPAEDEALHARVDAVLAAVEGAGPLCPCHADHGPQNLHAHDGRIITFDFDNLHFQPLALDLAVPWSRLVREPPGAVADFVAGYRAVAPLPDGMVADMPRWLAVRRVYVLLSRLDLWPAPTSEQRALLARYRRLALGIEEAS